MLSNLLSNAIKFTPAGGSIEVTLNRTGDEAELRVADTGQGIPAEHLPHIFDRFYRVRGQSEQASPEKGLGLGLSFVAWIVRAHGGSVDVRSKPGLKRTTFRIVLPLHQSGVAQDRGDIPGSETMNRRARAGAAGSTGSCSGPSPPAPAPKKAPANDIFFRYGHRAQRGSSDRGTDGVAAGYRETHVRAGFTDGGRGKLRAKARVTVPLPEPRT